MAASNQVFDGKTWLMGQACANLSQAGLGSKEMFFLSEVPHAPIKELTTLLFLLTPVPAPRPFNDHKDDTLSNLRCHSGQTSFEGQGTIGYQVWAVRWLVTAGGYWEMLYLCFLPSGFEVLH